MNANELREKLQTALGIEQVIFPEMSGSSWLSDWRDMYHGTAAAVVRPRTTQQVAQCLAICNSLGVPVIPRGGNTNLCGGATPDTSPLNVVVSLDRMNSIKEVDPLSNTMIAEAGCILGDLKRAAIAHSRLLPLSLAAEDSCQLGGNIATNAGGVNVVRYGMARDLVLGLEVVLPSGEIWNGLRTLRKDNTGYDLKQLFIGSEGTLGIVTTAALRLFPATRTRAVALAAVQTPQQALDLSAILFNLCGQRVEAFEYFTGECLDLVITALPNLRSPFPNQHPGYVLIELADSEDEVVLLHLLEEAIGEAIERECCLDVVIANSLTQSKMLWQLREDISEAQRLDGPHLKHDISLPISQIPDFMKTMSLRLQSAFPDLRLYVFGHFGDGNLHYNISRPCGASLDYFKNCADAVVDLVLDEVNRRDGSFSAEHGIGQLKRKYLRKYKSAVEIQLMEGIKRTFDPKNIMNPGKIF